MAITCNIVIGPPAGTPYENTKTQTALHIAEKYAQTRNIFFLTRKLVMDFDQSPCRATLCSGPAFLSKFTQWLGALIADAADPATVTIIKVTPKMHSTAVAVT
jgi:hypothetical protein